ncbi:hypothetical protein [Streptomyces sp. NPDC056647]|uniref:hypothetical protein n=1 Tax=unclassified Streptomyces TaxID=2593676 RepID=UPI003679F824
MLPRPGTGSETAHTPDAACAPPDPGHRSGRRRDLVAAGAGALLFAVAAVSGTLIEHYDGTLHVSWPPLLAQWMPHLGPGTLPALLTAVAVIAYGPPLAARLSWRRLTWLSWAAALAWTWALALVDGWQRGVVGRLTTRHEYLSGVDRFDDIPATLRDFTKHILIGPPDNWPTHIAGHPPGAILTFVGLDRIGLGGGAWAAAFCVVTGASTAAAVLVTLRALGAERAARAAAPFLVLAPGAVWVGASADGYFAAVAGWALALLALAATRTVRAPRAAALGSGLLFGATVHLSYGLTLMVVPAVAVLVLARRARPRPAAGFAVLGFAAVAVAFLLAGFHWWEAYELLVERYYQGVARERPYGYWLWANGACAVIAAGLAAVAGIRRLPAAVRGVQGSARGSGSADRTVALLMAAVLLALLVADLSGMSKAETERIWLPFTLWLPAAAALLPSRDHRGWLAAQACLALLVNHLLLTSW